VRVCDSVWRSSRADRRNRSAFDGEDDSDTFGLVCALLDRFHPNPPSLSEPDEVIQRGLELIWKMTVDAAQGYEERRVTLRKAGVLGVLPPVVAAFTDAEIEAGMHPDAEVQNNKVRGSYRVVQFLVGVDRLDACMKGEDPLSDMLTEQDMMVVIGTGEEPGFCVRCVEANR